jgi:iron complex outermembrane receptor protein
VNAAWTPLRIGGMMFGRALVRLSAAACFAVAGSPAWAQEAAQTAGGDVTADEATPLPPVVVSAPKERRPARASRQTATPQQSPTAASPSDLETIATSGSGSESYATAPGGSVGIFTLGQLDLIGGSTITNEAMWTYNKQSVDQAINILPGVSSHSAGGSRNERDIFVRGFDRFRVPLSLDGVRIYLPADNRIDFSRFLTPDLAEIQVQKGYVSVLNGPGGLGGAINLVSRKPTKEIELEGRSGAVFNGDLDDMNSWNSYAYAGTRRDMFYAQVSGNIVDQDHFSLSHDFEPTSPAAPNVGNGEDGGDRDNSEFRDWRVNAKVGLTPNATDEYALNYTTQHGSKSAPLHTDGLRVQGPRYWQTPEWDMDNLAFLSKTQIGEASYVKTNVYYNTFNNLLRSFNNRTYSQQVRNPQDFDSYYDDYAYGGSFEAGTNLIPMNTLKATVHYRRDNHTEHSIIAPVSATPVHEPDQSNVEDTWSVAAENTFHATRRLDLVLGAGYDWLQPKLAEDFNAGALFERETPGAEAYNAQGAAIYSYSDTGKTHVSISDRARFATAFERYSTRFGIAIPNPDLAPERAVNYEIGVADTIFRTARVSASVFYATLQDSIQPVYFSRTTRPGAAAQSNSIQLQNQNVDGEHYGVELSADWDVTPRLRVGGNYTYLERKLDYDDLSPTARPEGTPRHEAFIYLAWRPIDRLTLTPSLELASDRNALITSAATSLIPNPQIPVGSPPVLRNPNYIETGSYTLLNLQAEYQFTDSVSAAIGATNVLDDNYALAEGFPEPGRQFFANARMKF